MNKCLKPLLAVLVFALTQMLVVGLAIVAGAILRLCKAVASGGAALFVPDVLTAAQMSLDSDAQAWVVMVSGLITVLLLARPMGLLRLPQTFDVRAVHWRWVPVVVLACIAGVLGANLLTELFRLPNWLDDDFAALMISIPGVLTVGVVAPVVEELVFREGLLGGLLRRGVPSVVAILMSGILFGAIHFNPAQIPAASIIGVMLAVIYWRTGNVVLPALLHVTNNLFCVAQYWWLGDAADSFSTSEWVGGDAVAVPVMSAALMMAAVLMTVFVRFYPRLKDCTTD